MKSAPRRVNEVKVTRARNFRVFNIQELIMLIKFSIKIPAK